MGEECSDGSPRNSGAETEIVSGDGGRESRCRCRCRWGVVCAGGKGNGWSSSRVRMFGSRESACTTH